jgi:hypothetical protein
MSKVNTQAGFYKLKETDKIESLGNALANHNIRFNCLFLWPASGIDVTGKRVANSDSVFIGERTTDRDVTPDELESDANPFKIQLPEGEEKLLKDVLIQGTAGDGVWFNYWPIACLVFCLLTGLAGSAAEQAIKVTGFTRDYLKATNAASARSKLGLVETNVFVIAGTTLYVATNGNDATGLPWLRISNAVAAAAAGQTVHVTGGTYYETVTCKEGVILYLEPGAILRGRTQTTDQSVFWIPSTCTNLIIRGSGTIWPYFSFVFKTSSNIWHNLDVEADSIGDPADAMDCILTEGSFNRARFCVKKVWKATLHNHNTNAAAVSDYYDAQHFGLFFQHHDFIGTNRWWNSSLDGSSYDENDFDTWLVYGGKWRDAANPLEIAGGDLYFFGTEVESGSAIIDPSIGATVRGYYLTGGQLVVCDAPVCYGKSALGSNALSFLLVTNSIGTTNCVLVLTNAGTYLLNAQTRIRPTANAAPDEIGEPPLVFYGIWKPHGAEPLVNRIVAVVKADNSAMTLPEMGTILALPAVVINATNYTALNFYTYQDVPLGSGSIYQADFSFTATPLK